MNSTAQSVARALAYCEAHCDSEEEERLVRWVTEHVGRKIKGDHPRFNRGEFEIAALPIYTRDLRSTIVARIALEHCSAGEQERR